MNRGLISRYAGLVLLVAGAPASIAPTSAEPQVVASSAPSPARALQAAELLHDFGTSHDDPVALVSAARLLLAAGFAAEDDELGDLTPQRVLREAAAMATTGSREEAIIADTFASPRGVLQGASTYHDMLKSGESTTYRMVFAGRELADVAVRLKGDVGADIDIRVVDDQGQFVAGDELPTHGIVGHLAYTQWMPATCGEFEIQVVNNGDAEASFLLASRPSLSSGCR